MRRVGGSFGRHAVPSRRHGAVRAGTAPQGISATVEIEFFGEPVITRSE